MPKIIENLEKRLLDEAKNQIASSGYATVTIRSVAKECGVGVGTVYNYFPSKDALIATAILEDWKACLSTIQAVSEMADQAETVCRCIYENLQHFADLHASVFQDEAAAAGFAGSFSQYHSMLRSQLAQPLRKFCSDDYSSEFLAEALLTWTMHGQNFDTLYAILQKILQE